MVIAFQKRRNDDEMFVMGKREIDDRIIGEN